MADGAIGDSSRRSDGRLSAASTRPRDFTSGLPFAAFAAIVSAVMFELSGADPRLYPFALLAPLPILAVAPELRVEIAAQLAFLAFLIGNLVTWGGESFATPLVTMLASHVMGAVVFAAFVACAAEATRRWPGWLAALVFPTFEVAFYFTLSLESPHGTWGSPAYSQVDFREFLQTASWLGMCGVMFIMSLLPSGLAVAWYRRRWNMDWVRPAIMALGVFAVAIMLGWVRVILAPTTPSVRVAMVASENLIPESESTDAGDAADVMTQYAKLVRQVAVNGTQVVVLPEKIIGVAPNYEWDVVQGFQRIASISHVWLVVGINQIGRTPKRNIAIVISPDGKIVAAYAKHHLVPSLESDYKPGSKPAIFDAPWGRTAVLISQDLDFPATARELAAQDVRIVLAPASDWTGSELIHQQMAVVRGVEFGFSLARAARGGILSASCSRGKQIATRSPIHTEDTTLTADIPLGTGSTLYSRTGDWFGHLCQIFAILLLLRLGVTLLYAEQTRRRGAAKRIKPVGVVSVDLVKPDTPLEQPVAEGEIYRPPPRTRDQS
jgi:apolipoprotein N-acyltransferase